MDNKALLSKLNELHACRGALSWIRERNLATAWAECERADWMLWLCGHMVGTDGWPSRQQIVLVACICAERALPLFEKKYPDDKRPRKAIEAARAAAAAYAVAAAYAAAYAAARSSELKAMADIVREHLKVPS